LNMNVISVGKRGLIMIQILYAPSVVVLIIVYSLMRKVTMTRISEKKEKEIRRRLLDLRTQKKTCPVCKQSLSCVFKVFNHISCLLKQERQERGDA